jgi:hypothetical protein
VEYTETKSFRYRLYCVPQFIGEIKLIIYPVICISAVPGVVEKGFQNQ